MPATRSSISNRPCFPKVAGEISWSDDGKSVTLPVSLVPEHDYEFWLNRGRFNSFRSRDGAPLASVHETFRTGKVR